eukprot:TRINITY_DN27642_c0_g1_i1.p1 TRINITY_DN27642_c0_g1~~TRINITY_DN27642_c0_g1_i1.p1  ORF type:complete len:375 (+),score=36.76 TRINITY_DN27642_c0_g1_i1:45-1169(+)
MAIRVCGDLQRQLRWARGGEFARRHKAARELRGREYPGHSSEYMQSIRHHGREHGEASYKFKHFMDKDGGIDFITYGTYMMGRVVHDNRSRRDNYTKSQHDAPEQLLYRIRSRNTRLRLEGKYRRWKPTMRSIGGVRHVGRHRSLPESEKRAPDNTTDEPSYEETVEKVVIKIPDPYKVLSIPKDATLKHAAANYRRLAKKYHPDSPTGSVEKMAKLNTSYAIVKQIIKEGGPDKSPTAVDCDQHETEERLYKVKRKMKTAKGTQTVSGHDDLDAFELKYSKDGEELEALRKMALNFKKTVRAKDRRSFLKRERTHAYSIGTLPPTNVALSNKLWFELAFWLCTLIFFICCMLPKNAVLNNIYNEDPLVPPIRV